MEKFLFAAALAFGPPALYVWAAVHPETTAWASSVALAGALLPFVSAALLRRGAAARPDDARLARLSHAASWSRWVGLVMMLAALVFIPNMMWAVRMGHCGMNELWTARQRVEDFRKARGRAPSSLVELGPLPRLRIWTVSEREAEHFHPETTRVSIVRGDGPPPDDGSWGYDPDTGRVFLSCTGLEPKLRHTPLYRL